MDINEYISSGILELYVYGALSESESAEVTRTLREYPEVRQEVEEIEKHFSPYPVQQLPTTLNFYCNP